MVPYHSHSDPQPLTPKEIRLWLEIVNGDSPATEILWAHYYRPDKIGSDTIHPMWRIPWN
jgi:hypothetical protein